MKSASATVGFSKFNLPNGRHAMLIITVDNSLGYWTKNYSVLKIIFVKPMMIVPMVMNADKKVACL